MKATAEFFKVFSDPTRFRILHALSLGEFCVCEIADGIEAPQYTVSRHLAGLRKSGYILERREGTWIYYRLAPAHEGLIKEIVNLSSANGLDKGTLQKDAQRLKSRLRLREDGKCVRGYDQL